MTSMDSSILTSISAVAAVDDIQDGCHETSKKAHAAPSVLAYLACEGVTRV